MKRSFNLKTAVSFVDDRGILLVFPVNNRADIPSLWQCFYPRSKMEWEWDENGDDRVAKLWHLREELSRSGQVVYTKWFRGRATLFSHDLFVTMSAALDSPRLPRGTLSKTASEILNVLNLDSPLSTKKLKALTDLKGRFMESTYERSMKELWSKLLIVGFGEVDEGAFPSLAIGSTQLLFENLWSAASELKQQEAKARLVSQIGKESPFLKFFEALRGRSGKDRSISSGEISR